MVTACMALIAGGCETSPVTVANPDYLAWAKFAPGSSVTFEGIQKTNESKQSLRVTEKLLARYPEKVVLERTTLLLNGDADTKPRVVRRVERAEIHPADHPRTHPDAKITEAGTESLQIAGKTFVCRVINFDVHAKNEGFMKTASDLHSRACLNPDIPGGLAKVHLTAKAKHHSFEIDSRAVDFKVAAEREE
jgi:hypothetical protein